jgi:hypothetical protein
MLWGALMIASIRRALLCFGALTVVGAIACVGSEPTGVDRSASDGSRAAFSKGNLTASTVDVGTDTVVTVFTVFPSATSAYPIASVHRLWIRAGGICDLNSVYGPGHWDDRCVPATDPIVITAKSWVGRDGHPHIDFLPRLRFVPLGGKRASAEVYLRDKKAASNPKSAILYCDNGSCFDESIGDPTLTTQHDKQQGFVYRRIKHFSGYEVVVGRDETTDTTSTTQP